MLYLSNYTNIYIFLESYIYYFFTTLEPRLIITTVLQYFQIMELGCSTITVIFFFYVFYVSVKQFIILSRIGTSMFFILKKNYYSKLERGGGGNSRKQEYSKFFHRYLSQNP